MYKSVKRFILFVALLALVVPLSLSASSVSAAKADRQFSEGFNFGSLQRISVAAPVLELGKHADDADLHNELLAAIYKELDKADLYLTEEDASVKTDASLQITLKKLELGELTEPAHVNWHRQNNSVTLPTADGKSSTSIDLGVSIPEFVPERKYPTVVVTALFTLTDNATGEIIYTREQERSEGNTHSPGNTLSKLVKEFHKDLSKLIKKQAK